MNKKSRDYIPPRDKDLVAFGKNFKTILAGKLTLWNITKEEYTELSESVDNFESLVDEAYGPERTKMITSRKNAVRTDLTKQLRGLVKFKLKNPIITAEDRISLGLNVPDSIRTKIGVPEKSPSMNLRPWNIRQISVQFHETTGKDENKSNAKPYGMVGASIIYNVLDKPPLDQSELFKNVLATRSPHVISFPENERGKTAYFAICWQNRKGQRGPWSDIFHAIIP